MKFCTYTIVAACAFAAAGAFAQQKMDDIKGMDMGKKPSVEAKQATHKAKATVKKADNKAGTVTLAHEPVESLNWPSMTMNFKVKDKMLWSKLGDGKKVDVEFVKDGDDYVVTKVK
ncbi:MAG: copper-binding protein [Burkholderiales bacterium]|nr:copper-binding protein [Burkholderiales bacterium]